MLKWDFQEKGGWMKLDLSNIAEPLFNHGSYKVSDILEYYNILWCTSMNEYDDM